MRRVFMILVLTAVACLAGAPLASADERAEMGTVLAVGNDDSTLLVSIAGGFQLVVVPASAEIRGPGHRPLTLGQIRPGDLVDYSISTWAGMEFAEVVHVTPQRQVGARH